jgi:undecaprenyl-diphosphatase
MSLFQAIVLAVVQGLTEFLPVSSTAHLVLFPWLAGWPEPGLAFDVALHLGTLVAVVLYFLRDWIELVLLGLGIRKPNGQEDTDSVWKRRLFWLLVVGSIPAGILGLLFEKVIEEKLREPYPIAIALIGVALLMWWAEHWRQHSRQMPDINLGDSVTVGIAQAAALFPGVSRSGITITAGMWRKMTRETAARFSFLLSTPVIAGAALHEVPKLLKAHNAGALDIPLSTIAVAIAVSGIVGYLGIAFFLRYLQTRTLKLFIVYRILLGIVVLLVAFLHLGYAR